MCKQLFTVWRQTLVLLALSLTLVNCLPSTLTIESTVQNEKLDHTVRQVMDSENEELDHTEGQVQDSQNEELDHTEGQVQDSQNEVDSGAECQDVTTHKNLHLLPKDTECGPVSVTTITTKIMRGRVARPGEFPWMAQLLQYPKFYRRPRPGCGGSVINDKYITTAAHCVLTYLKNVIDPTYIVVRLGALDTYNTVPCLSSDCSSSVVDFAAEQIIYHEEYNKHNKYHHQDIALVRVVGRIKFNEFIRTICLPTSCTLMMTNFTGVSLEIMGWGIMSDLPREVPSGKLRTAAVVGSDLHKCNESWVSAPVEQEPVEVISTQICSRRDEGVTCNHDSGGPLVYIVPHRPMRNVMVGIVSQGPYCDSSNPFDLPNIFTRVSSFMPWILDHIRE